MNHNPPISIVFEGLDLTGKTLLAQALCESLDIPKPIITLKNRYANLEKELIQSGDLKGLEKHYRPLFNETPDPNQSISIYDRGYPSIISFSEENQTGLASSEPLSNFWQPTFFVYLECPYETKLERLEQRINQRIKPSPRDLELLSSHENHNLSQEIYRQIMRRIKIDCSTVLTFQTHRTTIDEIIGQIKKRI